MIISLIAALDDKGGLGFKGGLPWPHNSADLVWFKEVTMGKTLIVGQIPTKHYLPSQGARYVC